MSAPAPTLIVPEGFTLHKENTSAILLPASNDAFLNPVQEFNRDLSVACIRTWGDLMNKEKEKKWRQSLERRAKKAEAGHKAKKAKTEENGHASEQPAEGAAVPQETSEGTQAPPEFRPQRFVILEALSATGLRSIRYANEIPLVKYVIANDLSPAAVEAMRRNIELNDMHEKEVSPSESSSEKVVRPAKVRVNEGDACALMYNHRAERNRVDVVDLDPYGTAAPFVDASVQCVNDGGLLCVTCTDMSVLATTNYPEKCFSNYGGAPVKAEYCHEAALRLVLHTLATSAARYGRYIQPLLSLSIDFYVRIFVRVYSSPIDVKKVFSKTAIYYVCTGCQSFYEQPIGRMVENVSGKGNVNLHFKAHTGPPVSERCPECNSALHAAGPMWSGPLHDPEFVGSVLGHVESNEDKYGTSARMKGMLTVAKEELDTPFYFTPSRVSSHFHCVCPSLDETASALLHAGYKVSRSHACAGSLKTTATYADIHDIFRSWVKTHPVRMDKISENSPARHLLSKEPRIEANFKRHPDSVTPSSKVKLVRYQQNPTPNWGPGAKPSGKRKRNDDD
ncbi:N2,N2-dimethylguanosine tRNA methyltransferase [Dichomitus squalens LYAD-421 SS1]|uniref:N2,N2-dimethylguanosine tRNA methyltransferase n=1 Tax=Dichomitus squalens (strain LYAD-421) TaxID=732165 RepID=UPI00044142D0|nr:N2,N2-dimethylguanosine tRNA methyltransferase [Dichomitus squalens LYAD-421 SS1]EJF65938.1 N2,N2-dimethylguanosine tRNA methyltransferase [Dichomitus squalens LYAD-421 SS1]